MPDTTTNYSLNKPITGAGSPDIDLWGGQLNSNFDTIDTQMKANEDDISTNTADIATNTAAILTINTDLSNVPKYLTTPVEIYTSASGAINQVDQLFSLPTSITDLNPTSLIIETNFYLTAWNANTNSALWIEPGNVANITKSNNNLFWGIIEGGNSGTAGNGGNTNTKIINLDSQTSLRYTLLLNITSYTGSITSRIIGYI